MTLLCSRCGGTQFQKKGIEYGKQQYMCVSKSSDGNICGCRKYPIIMEDSNISEFTDKRVLVIPDTHFPFVKQNYIPFLKQVYDEYNCDTVVHLGDMIDNHYSSFHDTDPDGHSALLELQKALDCVKELHDVFPNMIITYGNHDVIPNRKAFSSGLSNTWIKSIKDVIIDNGIPAHGWDFVDHCVIDDVVYTHGVSRGAKQRMSQEMVSVVCGHWHTKSSVDWLFNDKFRLFAMQLGALIDDKAYAFAYAKHFAKSFKNCGVVINGKIPIIIPMDL
jgi:metallophosphoesterase superfamily enzyme